MQQQIDLSPDKYSTEKDGNILQDILSKYLPWWPLFVILSAWVYLRYATPIYESKATLLIKDQKKGLDDSNLMESLNLFGSKKIIENEIEVIKSRSIAKEVVKKLYLYAPIIQEGRVRNNSGYVVCPVWVEVKNPDSLIAVSHVPFSYNDETDTITFNKKGYALFEWIETRYGTLRFIPNPVFRQGDAKKPFYFSLISLRSAASQLISRLQVSASSKQSTVINIKYRDDEPKRAENIIDGVIAEYNRASVYDKNQLASNTLAFIEERLKNVFNELDSVEHSLTRF
ncbi:MAG: hypothetical protein J0I84_11950, partial [Terrimonas sp.]|nr:hypothetical protein [Terrimonas sp.]